MRKLLPIPLLGFDTDNDSVFLNGTVRDHCQSAGVSITGSGRPCAPPTKTFRVPNPDTGPG